MGKVKDYMEREYNNEFELALGYKEWLRDNFLDPTIVEIMDMAEEVLSAETMNELFWDMNAENNSDYIPDNNKGA